MKINIPQNIDTQSIDIIHQEFSPNANNEIVLKSLKIKASLGTLSEAIQLIVTISKRSKNLKLTIPNIDLIEPNIEDELTNPITLACILMSEEVFMQSMPTSPIKKKLSPFLARIFDSELPITKRRSAILMAIDHSIPRFRNPIMFYRRNNFVMQVRPASDFETLINRYLSTLVKEEDPKRKWIENLAVLFHEIIKNTDDHALIEWHSNQQNRSIRGGVFRYNMIPSSSKIDNFAQKSTPEYLYLCSIAKGEENEERLRFIELSFFDSGKGLYKTYFYNSDDNSPPIKHEIEKTIECFQKHKTSKKYGEGFGVGLYAALQALNEIKGFLKIRTGRLKIIIDCSNHHDSIDFKDTRVVKILEDRPVEGVSYTVLIPVM